MSLRFEKDIDQNQEFILTLSEGLSSPSSGSSYYFVFENDQMNNTYTKTLTDTSNYYIRYNKFTLNTEIGGVQTNNISFAYEGWYSYKCYENTGTTTLLEMGKCYIYDNDTPSSGSTYTSSNNIYVYSG